MSIYVGTNEIKNIYVGTTPVKEVYVGTTKVWPNGPSLLTYKEIVAIGDNSAILTELNKDPEGYYNSLNNSGNVHIGGESTDYYIWNGTDLKPTRIDGYRYRYDPSSKIWDKGNSAMSPRISPIGPE